MAYLDRRFYPGIEGAWDDVALRRVVLTGVVGPAKVLDIGAGAGIVSAMDFQTCGFEMHGIDLDPRVLDNPYLDEASIGRAESLPYADRTFDAVISDNVLEHLDRPADVFSEIARVLKPGGVFIFKTPNRSHYMPLIARLSPHRFHNWVNGLRGRDSVDTFPTRYLANSPRQIRELARSSGLIVDGIELLEMRPEYLRFNVATYLPGIGYERLVNSSERLSRFRIVLIGRLRRAIESGSPNHA